MSRFAPNDEELGWICTDPDCLQYSKKINDMSWDYIECRVFPDNQHIVCGMNVNLLDYSSEDVLDYISGYYDSMVEVVMTYGLDNGLKIAAESIFEQTGLEEMELCKSYPSFDEAEKFVKSYISENG